MSRKATPALVEIEWVDSASTRGWGHREPDIVNEPLLCRTVGYLVKRDRVAMTCAMNQAPSEADYGQLMTIPMPCVRRVRRLR